MNNSENLKRNAAKLAAAWGVMEALAGVELSRALAEGEDTLTWREVERECRRQETLADEAYAAAERGEP